MEWYLLNQNNTTYSICINVDTKNTIDIFVRNRTGGLFHGRSSRDDYNNAHTAVLLDVFKYRRKGLHKNWRMATADIMLSFRHGCTGFLAIGDLKKPDNCCCIGLSLVKQKGYIHKLHSANEDLMAVTALIDLKQGK